MSLNISLSYSKSLMVIKMVPFQIMGNVSYSHFIATMAVYLAVCEIFSVKEWRDLKIWLRGLSRS